MKGALRLLLAGLFGVAILTGCTGSQFSFVVMSDVHLQGGNPQQRRIIDSMIYLTNNSGKIVRERSGMRVSKPFGLFVTGDLTDSGTPEGWKEFEEIFGLNGEGSLEMPVYETFGNHDGGVNGVVREGIRHRNTLRKDVIMTSANGLHYTVERNGYLFIVLGSYPGGPWDPGCEWCHYFKESFREAEGSLDFLEKALKNNSEDRNLPVFLFFHYGWDDFSMLWWTPAEQQRFFSAIRNSRVETIFHGHNHQIDSYIHEDYDVLISGSPQRGEKAGEVLFVSVSKGEIQAFVLGNSKDEKLKRIYIKGKIKS